MTLPPRSAPRQPNRRCWEETGIPLSLCAAGRACSHAHSGPTERRVQGLVAGDVVRDLRRPCPRDVGRRSCRTRAGRSVAAAGAGQGDVLVERLVLVPRRRLHRADDLPGDAQLGERPERRLAVGPEVPRRLEQADHPLLLDVVEVGPDEEVAAGLGPDETAIALEEDIERFGVAMLGTNYQLIVANIGSEDALVAAVNGPRSLVLSGMPDALLEAVAELQARGVEARDLQLDYAFHSAQMTDLAEAFARDLGEVKRTKASTPVFSTLTGAALAGDELDGAYLAGAIRKPVRFADAITAMEAAGVDTFVAGSAIYGKPDYKAVIDSMRGELAKVGKVSC